MGLRIQHHPALWPPSKALARFHAEIVTVDDIAHAGNSTRLNEPAILAADLTRPVILAEIAPARFNLIDGHHRVEKARREGVLSILGVPNPLPRACGVSYLDAGVQTVCGVLELQGGRGSATFRRARRATR